MIQGVIFDMDGVLFDTEAISWRTKAEAGKRFGVTFTEEEQRDFCSLEWNLYLEKMKGIAGEYAERLIEEHERLFIEAIKKELPLKPGVRELLRYLKDNGYFTAVASSTGYALVIDNLTRGGIVTLFDAILGGDKVKRSKPDPEIYITATRLLGLSPRECMAVEDSRNGMRSAAASGCLAVMVPDLTPADDEMRGLAHAVAAGLMDIPAILEEVNAKRE